MLRYTGHLIDVCYLDLLGVKMYYYLHKIRVINDIVVGFLAITQLYEYLGFLST